MDGLFLKKSLSSTLSGLGVKMHSINHRFHRRLMPLNPFRDSYKKTDIYLIIWKMFFETAIQKKATSFYEMTFRKDQYSN